MNSVANTLVPMQPRVAAICLSIAFGVAGVTCATPRSADEVNVPDTIVPSTRMPDGKQWMTENLTVTVEQSYCYDDAETNCRRYGRLYTWESAQRGCRSLGAGWRLPTSDEWRQLANHYGGVSDASDDRGRSAYSALLIGGSTGFDAVLGGGRGPDGSEYARLDAHGFYWTASESSPGTAWFFNFARGGLALHAQRDGEKERAFSVRCVRE